LRRPAVRAAVEVVSRLLDGRHGIACVIHVATPRITAGPSRISRENVGRLASTLAESKSSLLDRRRRMVLLVAGAGAALAAVGLALVARNTIITDDGAQLIAPSGIAAAPLAATIVLALSMLIRAPLSPSQRAPNQIYSGRNNVRLARRRFGAASVWRAACSAKSGPARGYVVAIARPVNLFIS
jgi:hypothetical protein